MAERFSTRTEWFCPQPQLTVGFPTTGCGPNTVTLANGAVVDLCVLAQIITEWCPAVAEAVSGETAAELLCPSSEPELARIFPFSPFI
ncbi:MAG: hypothetical protein JWN15_685 [Firmicutes bacterium]|nr:hypothetical protein [Bacillota bacterium]